MRRADRIKTAIAATTAMNGIRNLFILALTIGAGPLDADEAEKIGAETCVSCHADKENFSKSLHGEALESAKKIPFEESCETCHGAGSLHAAAAGDKSDPGFKTTSLLDPANRNRLSSLCLKCHNTSHAQWKNSAHDKAGLVCANCHSLHNPKGPKHLSKKTQAETCAKCHIAITRKMKKASAMPLAQGRHACTSCHKPHGSSASKLLAKNTANETCFQCHADKRGPFLWEHAPVRENCLNCHDAHGSSNHAMLSSRMPFLCQRCHQKGSFHQTGKMLTGQDLANQSAFLVNRSCANCHSLIHGSNHPSGKGLTR